MTNNAYSGNEIIGYEYNNVAVRDNTNNRSIFWNTYPDYYYYFPIWYPETRYITEKSKIEQSMKIISKLLESKIITKELTVKEFIKLVNDVAELI